MTIEWYYKIAGEEFGPFSSAQLKAEAASGRLTMDCLIRRSNDPEWYSAAAVKGLFRVPAAVSGDAKKRCPWCAEKIAAAAIKCKHCGEMLIKSPEVSNRYILVALLLWLLFGTVGAHAFYAGRSIQGFALLLMFALGAVLIIFAPNDGLVYTGVLLVVLGSIFLSRDLIRLLIGKYKDSDGKVIRTWTP